MDSGCRDTQRHKSHRRRERNDQKNPKEERIRPNSINQRIINNKSQIKPIKMLNLALNHQNNIPTNPNPLNQPKPTLTPNLKTNKQNLQKEYLFNTKS